MTISHETPSPTPSATTSSTSDMLGDLAEALTLLKIAFGMDMTLKRIALDDSDLEPLWATLGKSTDIP